MSTATQQYHVTVGSQKHLVSLREVETHRWEVALGTRSFTVDGQTLANGGLSLICEGRSFDVQTANQGEHLDLVINGERFRASVLGEQEQFRREHQKGGAGACHGQLLSPMAGKIVRWLVAEGATVTAGQALVVVEAMKMENELKAPQAGVVGKFRCASGSTVESGQTLTEVG